MSTKRFITSLSQHAIDDLQALAVNITIARKARGLSQREMAERCTMAFSTYQAVERGSPEVSFGAVLAVLDVLEMTEGLRNVAAPQNDPLGVAMLAGRRRSS